MNFLDILTMLVVNIGIYRVYEGLGFRDKGLGLEFSRTCLSACGMRQEGLGLEFRDWAFKV